MGFIEVQITPEMFHRAKEHASSMGGACLVRENYERDEFIGSLGEECFKKVFKNCVFEDKRDYDFLSDKNKKVEVKTNSSHFPPKMHYDLSHSINTEKSPDYYVFVQVMRDKTKGFLLGWLSRDEYYLEKGRKINKGDPMQQGGVFKFDGLQVFIRDLHLFKKEKI